MNELFDILREMVHWIDRHEQDIAFLKLWQAELRAAIRTLIGWNTLLTLWCMLNTGWLAWRAWYGRS